MNRSRRAFLRAALPLLALAAAGGCGQSDAASKSTMQTPPPTPLPKDRAAPVGKARRTR